MFKKLVTDFSLAELKDGYAVTLIIIFVVSVLNEKGILIREKLSQKNIVLRWLVFLSLILFIVIFGAYGAGYDPVDPIYANF